jgi:hypothetical protein
LRDLTSGRRVELFADRAGLDAEEVVRASPLIRARSRTVELHGEVLQLGDWSLRSRRRCPICVQTDADDAGRIGIPAEWWATSRSWWDIRSIDVCPEHHVRMIDRCAACGTLHGWKCGLLVCRCGARNGARACIEGDPAFSRYVLGRLSLCLPTSVPILDGMVLSEAVRTSELLGASRLTWSPTKPKRTYAEESEDRLQGLRIACDWPSGLLKSLDELVAGYALRPASGLIAAYGWVYSEMCMGDVSRATSDLVIDVVREHAVRSGIIASDEDRLGGVVPATITAKMAAKCLGYGYERTRRTLEQAGAIPTGSRRGVAFALDPSAVRRLSSERRLPSSARLSIGRTQARNLLRDERLRLAVPPDAGDRVSALVSVVRSLALPGDRQATVPLPLACRNMSVPLAAACRGIIDRKVRVRLGGTDEGLRAVLVRQADLAALRARSDRMTVQAIARESGLHHEAVRALVRCGAFGETERGQVSAVAVRRFLDEHVTAAELSRDRNTSPSAVRRTLERMGVVPAFGPPECRQLIYLRCDLPTVH